jgi:hypothetical protein
MSPAKPKFGTACNGCGVCCQISMCVVAELTFPGIEAPCPALFQEEDGRHRCGIVIMENHLGVDPVVKNTLGIGCGCSMCDDDTTLAETEGFDQMSKRMILGELPFQTSRE